MAACIRAIYCRRDDADDRYLVDPEKVDFRHIDVESGGLQGLAGTEVRSR